METRDITMCLCVKMVAIRPISANLMSSIGSKFWIRETSRHIGGCLRLLMRLWQHPTYRIRRARSIKREEGLPLSRNGIGSKLEWKREEEGIEAGGESGGSLFRKGEGKGRGLFAKASSVHSVKQFANSKSPREKFDSYNVAVLDFIVFVTVRDQ